MNNAKSLKFSLSPQYSQPRTMRSNRRGYDGQKPAGTNCQWLLAIVISFLDHQLTLFLIREWPQKQRGELYDQNQQNQK